MRLASFTFLGVLLAHAAPAAAGPYSDVASAFDDGDKFDIHTEVDYELDVRRAAIKREFVALPGLGPDDPIPVVRDLLYSGTRHTLTPRITLSVFTDLALTVGLPIVITDKRTMKFDQRATPCVFPGGSDPATCVNRDNSTTIQDGLLPMNGYDAKDPTTGFTNPDSAMIFRGVSRWGLDQLHLGVVWAPMNQARDDTKPTWKLNAEVRIPVGAVAKVNRDDPDAEAGVGRGLYEVRLSTSVAKRIAWAEPYFEVWWLAPIGQKGSSPFDDPGFGAKRTPSQQQAGTRFGFEAIAWRRPEQQQQVSVDLSARLQANFAGRAYTEMWEVLALAGQAGSGGPLVLDSDPVTAGIQEMSYPGISNVENYIGFATRVGVRTELGDKVRFGGSFELRTDQAHTLTFADAGIDKPTCSGGALPPACESDSNDIVNSNTDEVNPLYDENIDLVGHRYRIEEATSYVFLADVRVLF
ncbi:MAG TPA: hypothetical protein VL172_06035 [Kofleriaceae bacterium]|nr:hypothetical protein [Kofleriaceae bacterium]